MKHAVRFSLIAAVLILTLFRIESAFAYTPVESPSSGGTGTSTAPLAGQLLIGNSLNTYSPAYLQGLGCITVATSSGGITLNCPIAPATTTLNGYQGPSFTVQGSGNVTSSVNASTTTFFLTNSGVASGTYNCANLTIASSGLITAASAGSCGGGGSATTTINSAPGPSFNFSATSTNSVLSIASSTSGGSSTIQFLLNLQNYLTAALLNLNGMNAPNQAVIAGTGLSYATSTSGSNATTTLTLSLNNGSAQTCSANQFVNTISATGTTNCGAIAFPAAITSINTATSSAQTIVGGTAISVSTAASSTNSTTTIANLGVTSFMGQGCVTAPNSTGTVALAVTCIAGNQTITFTINGDATGTASGSTGITDAITVTGLNGQPLPALATGTLQFSGGAWKINLATSSLGLYDINGNLSSYLGSSCAGGLFVTGFSASGTALCSQTYPYTLNSTSTTYTITNTTTLTTVYSLSIPANTLLLHSLQLTLGGSFEQNAVGTLSPFTLNMTYCGQSIASGTLQTTSQSSAVGGWTGTALLMDASGTQFQVGSINAIGHKGASNLTLVTASNGFNTCDSTQAQTFTIQLADGTSTATSIATFGYANAIFQ
jgi:hypothetical protein